MNTTGLAAAPFVVLLAVMAGAAAQDTGATPLWPDGAPGAKGKTGADNPAVFVYRPPKDTANGCAVVICPGGGYAGLAMDHEGHEVARWFNSFGVTALVLRYRHAPNYGHPIPMTDAARAVRYVRANASSLGVDAGRIGIMGFSAGGHLAATIATRHDGGNPSASDPVDRVSSRPDFAILCYPVITMTDPHTHAGSRTNLLGPNPGKGLIEALSAEKNVTKQTPPVFLFHTADDSAVPVENSLTFFAACRKAGVPVEMHIYRSGPHGVGMNRHPPVATWPSLAREWMENLGLTRKDTEQR